MRHSLYLLIALFLVSCTEDINITTDNQEPKLIIFGYITTDIMAHQVQLSRSVPYFGSFDPIQTLVSGAKVYINNTELKENKKHIGYFQTDPTFYGEEGKTYRLRVEVDFNLDGTTEVYTAEATMPPIGKMDSVSFSYGSIFGKNPPKDRPSITPIFNFKPLQNALYGGDFYYDTIKYTHKISNYELGILGTSGINQPYISYPLLGFRIRDYWVINSKDTIYTKPFVLATFTLNNMLPALYTFYSSSQIEMVPSVPLFGGQPANVESNISNGALGCFGAYAISKIKKVLPFTLYSLNGVWAVTDTTEVTNRYIKKNTAVVINNGRGLIPIANSKDSILYLRDFVLRTDVPKFAASILQPDGSYVIDTFFMDHYLKMTGKNGTQWKYKK